MGYHLEEKRWIGSLACSSRELHLVAQAISFAMDQFPLVDTLSTFSHLFNSNLETPIRSLNQSINQSISPSLKSAFFSSCPLSTFI